MLNGSDRIPVEQYAALRAAPDGAGRARGSCRDVTSAYPGEGKTLTATNPPHVERIVKRKVLLIDADLRRPVSTIFQLPNVTA